MSNVRVERSGQDSLFFRVGLEVLAASSQLFTLFQAQGLPRGGESVERRRVEAWEKFFKGEVRWLVLEGESAAQIEDLLWHVLDEAVNQPTTAFSRAKDSASGRYVATGGTPRPGSGPRGELPRQVPIVVSDSNVCYGCGKAHDESIGWHLEVGPFEVPCCPGRGEFDLKKSCRFEAIERLSACTICGSRAFECRGGGRACRDCLALVDEGARAKKMRGERAVVDVFDPRTGYDLSKALLAMLESMGAVKARIPGDRAREGASVPELAELEIRTFVAACDDLVERKYNEGLERGSNLLRGLADGTASASDYDAIRKH